MIVRPEAATVAVKRLAALSLADALAQDELALGPPPGPALALEHLELRLQDTLQ
jgi:hypothetical protein